MNEINDVIKRLQRVSEKVQSLDAQKIDLVKENSFVKGGPFLHQDTDEMSEEESAKFERSNQELFDFLRSLDEDLRDIF